MLHTDAKSLVEQGDRLFAAKRPLDSRNQEIASHFYPERADFTTERAIGADWAEHLITGYPSLVRRDLGNSIGSMLRPRTKQWFHVKADDGNETDHAAKAWLEHSAKVQRRAMYDRKSGFSRATKEGDHDFASFGGCSISTEVNRRDQALLYRCWHLRDMAWAEDQFGILSQYHRNWSPAVAELCAYFPETVHPNVAKRLEKEPEEKVKVRHISISAEEYNIGKRQPWVSLFVDVENKHILEERGSWTRIYTVPRWATVSGSQYPISPATLIALPDARLLQAMTMSLLDSSERASDPPLFGVAEAINGDLNNYAGGFTAVDAEYDERLGEVIRSIPSDKSGISFGLEMANGTRELLRETFFLNTLSMPPQGGPEMTAYEVGQRVQDYIRNALPLFEPMEAEYNGQLCDITFETLLREGAFGHPDDIPESIQGKGIDFDFESPLSEMLEREKGQKFLESKAMIAEALAIDPGAHHVMNFGKTLRDVLEGIGTRAGWMNSPEEEANLREEDAARQQAAELLEGMQGAADVTQKLTQAGQGFAAE